LTKKISKDSTKILKTTKIEFTTKYFSLATDDSLEEGYECHERDSNRIIQGNRKLYTAKNFRYHPGNGKLQIFKRLVLKSMEKVQKWLNPIQRIRIFDYEIRLDTTVLLDDIESRERIPTLTLDSFKRIVSITHDANKRTYKYPLEERFPTKQRLWKGVENFRYITKFLDSLGSTVAHDLSISLNHFLDNLNETNRKLSALFDSPVVGKMWIQRLNKATKDFIKSYPY
jgi:hypothetical protein